MTATPCAVDVCPCYAREGSIYCEAHRTAKKLPAVQKGRTCALCDRVLHEGDYVTLTSTATRIVHAQCPKPVPRTTKRAAAPTPLFNNAPGASARHD